MSQGMLPFQFAHYVMLPKWEGKIPWMYLDTHKDPSTGKPAPLVTVGIGCAIGLAEALTLPFQISGKPAGQDDIRDAFAKVSNMMPGRVATFYTYPNCLQLAEDGIFALVQKRYDVFTAELASIFPEFMSWPVTAQTGALDLIWGVGEGHPATPQHVATGLGEYTHWRAAAYNKDWATCAGTCGENVNVLAYTARNAWRKSLFLQAV